jgi:23S rRNA (cytidine1920-2'-O)/16S rRNA (cytidine1409-2'-O)-methyltransferase
MEFSKSQEHVDRLDVEMTKRKIVRSRSQAADLISRGKVFVSGKVAMKSSQKVDVNSMITVDYPTELVSRSGEKLAHALQEFNLDVKNLDVIDVGSSTGGFTQCLISRGARKVFAVDVGTNQLDASLRNNPRVHIHENTNIKKFRLLEPVDLIVIDVSFVSLKEILPRTYSLLAKSGKVIALVKPQFEVGMKIAKKNRGVISDTDERVSVLREVKKAAAELGFKILNETISPIFGEKGNREFLLLLQK